MVRTVRPFVIAAALLWACTSADDRPSPTQPSTDAASPGSGLALRLVPDPGPNADATNSLIIVPDESRIKTDSTSDICNQTGSPPVTCGIQGGTPATGFVVVECVVGPCTGTFQWSLIDTPPHATATFTPAITGVGELARYVIQPGDSTQPKVYNSQFLPAPLNGTPAPVPPTIPVRVHILCSYRLKSCPEVEIVDTLRANAVVSAPAPVQTTVIGKAVRLRVRHKAGTGTGQYTLQAGSWNGEGSVVKKYDLSSGVLTSLTTADLQDTLLSLYWTTASDNKGNVVKAAGLLLRDDGVRSQPRAQTTVVAKAPTSIRLSATTQPVRVGTYVSGTIALSLGSLLSRPTSSGIAFTFTATEPSQDQGGYVAATQLVRSESQYTRNPNGDPTAGMFPSTGGTFWLDACPLYPGVGFANGTFVQADGHGKFKYQADDAPGTILSRDFNAVTRTDAFQSFFMYRPSGAESIWVPLGVLPWGWGGTATRTIANPDVGNSWTGPTNASQSVGSSSLAAPFPTWTLTLPGPGCSALPT